MNVKIENKTWEYRLKTYSLGFYAESRLCGP